MPDVKLFAQSPIFVSNPDNQPVTGMEDGMLNGI
jgi:hypothetical protein